MSAPSAQPPLPLPPRALVAVLRAPTAERFVSASQVLWDAGITCFEYTLTSEGALDALVEARRMLPDAVVGVGTVRTTEHLADAAQAPNLKQRLHRSSSPVPHDARSDLHKPR